MEWLNNLVDTLVGWATTTGVKLIIALVILLISSRKNQHGKYSKKR